MNNHEDKTDDRKDKGGAAFPEIYEYFEYGNLRLEHMPGMELRTYAAIELRIPDSGIDWLDKMIARAERRDIAAKAMQELLTDSDMDYNKIIVQAYNIAGRIIAERAKGE